MGGYAALQYDSIVLGGGFYGCSVALHLAGKGQRTLLLEREDELLRRASYGNQARVHNGYHYPRSVLTALRCRVNASRLAADFPACIQHIRKSYYAIAQYRSSISARQFLNFCARIGAMIRPAPNAVVRIFNPHLTEGVFEVSEDVFNVVQLRPIIWERLNAARVEVRLATQALEILPLNDTNVSVQVKGQDDPITAGTCLNCTYANINQFSGNRSGAAIDVKYELAELALVEAPPEFSDAAITVMDGPFFSIMPFPPTKTHTLSHVLFTPHRTSFECPESGTHWNASDIPAIESNYPAMIRDAQRFVPTLAGCHHVGSIWEVKAVLTRSEQDDSRPIVYHQDPNIRGLWSVLGGKLDNIYDILLEMESTNGRNTAGRGPDS